MKRLLLIAVDLVYVVAMTTSYLADQVAMSIEDWWEEKGIKRA